MTPLQVVPTWKDPGIRRRRHVLDAQIHIMYFPLVMRWPGPTPIAFLIELRWCAVSRRRVVSHVAGGIAVGHGRRVVVGVPHGHGLRFKLNCALNSSG